MVINMPVIYDSMFFYNNETKFSPLAEGVTEI